MLALNQFTYLTRFTSSKNRNLFVAGLLIKFLIIFAIDSKARISIKGKLESREDYLYGGIEWEDGYIPIPYDQVLEKINEEKEKE